MGRESESPLQRIEHRLDPWVSFVIVPVFALANAGAAPTGDGSPAEQDADRAPLAPVGRRPSGTRPTAARLRARRPGRAGAV